MPDLEIEIVYARAVEQTIVRANVVAGTTVQDAVKRSGILRWIPAGSGVAYGIFGRRVSPDHQLADGDRIEIYQPLRADPRAARRARARPRRNRRGQGC